MMATFLISAMRSNIKTMKRGKRNPSGGQRAVPAYTFKAGPNGFFFQASKRPCGYRLRPFRLETSPPRTKVAGSVQLRLYGFVSNLSESNLSPRPLRLTGKKRLPEECPESPKSNFTLKGPFPFSISVNYKLFTQKFSLQKYEKSGFLITAQDTRTE